jgi:hypothetical protein
MTGKCSLINAECPQTSDPAARRYCPCWWEGVYINDKGETKVVKSCAWTQLPDYLSAVVKAANTGAVSSQEARDAALGFTSNVRALALTLHERNANDAKASAELATRSRPASLLGSGSVRPANVSDDRGGVE